MAYIRQIEPADASGLLKDIYGAAQRRAGSVANIIKVMGLDANAAKGSMQFYVSLMKSSNALTAGHRELLAAVVSNVNDCYY